MIEFFKERYKNKSIQHVIVTSFSAVFIIAFIFLAISFSYYGKKVIVDFIKQENEQQIDVLEEGIEREIKKASDLFDTVQYNIIKNEYSDRDTFFKLMDYACEKNKNDISSLVLFNDEYNFLYGDNDISKETFSESLRKQLYLNANKDAGKTMFLMTPDFENLILYRIVVTETSGNVEPAVLAAAFRFDNIVRGFEASNVKDENYFYITDADGNIIYHPKSKQIKHNIYKEKLGMDLDAEEGIWEKTYDGERYLIHKQIIGYTGWNIIGVSSLDKIIYNKYPIGIITWIAVFLVCSLSLVINHYIVKRITEPLEQLSNEVEKIGDDSLDSKIEIEGTCEITKLSNSFNDMQSRIKKYMDREVQKEQEHWSMKMKLLQSQINPHFLYNTLDSIIWMIQSKRYDGASKMVSALAGFFRISLNKGEDFINIGKEMTHVENYMEIQGIRFEDKFTFDISCDENLKIYMCPKLIIQPLAENAVYHGMEGMYGDGEINITARDMGDLIYIDVSDNGEGMTQEQIDRLICGDVVSSKRGSGIGVKNVNERIKHCFGNQYGIDVISEIDEGTTVRIIIPKVEDLNEYWEKEKNHLYSDIDDCHNNNDNAFSKHRQD